jgi:hypothetical protein
MERAASERVDTESTVLPAVAPSPLPTSPLPTSPLPTSPLPMSPLFTSPPYPMAPGSANVALPTCWDGVSGTSASPPRSPSPLDWFPTASVSVAAPIHWDGFPPGPEYCNRQDGVNAASPSIWNENALVAFPLGLPQSNQRGSEVVVDELSRAPAVVNAAVGSIATPPPAPWRANFHSSFK